MQRPPEASLRGPFGAANIDQPVVLVGVGFFLCDFLTFLVFWATCFFFDAFLWVVWCVVVSARAVTGTVEAATNDNSANAVMSAFMFWKLLNRGEGCDDDDRDVSASAGHDGRKRRHRGFYPKVPRCDKISTA